MLPELICVAAIVTSTAVIMYCMERRWERQGSGKTEITTYSDKVSDWQILEMTEKRMREKGGKLSKYN